jgi:hypothetical protein
MRRRSQIAFVISVATIAAGSEATADSTTPPAMTDVRSATVAGGDLSYARVGSANVVAADLRSSLRLGDTALVSVRVPLTLLDMGTGALPGIGNLAVAGTLRTRAGVGAADSPTVWAIGASVSLPTANAHGAAAAPMAMVHAPERYLSGAAAASAVALLRHSRRRVFFQAEVTGELVVLTEGGRHLAPLARVGVATGVRLASRLWATAQYTAGSLLAEPDPPGVNWVQAVDVALAYEAGNFRVAVRVDVPLSEVNRQFVAAVLTGEVGVRF